MNFESELSYDASHPLPKRSYRFPKWRRIHLKRDFDYVFKNGLRHTVENLTIWFCLSEHPLQVAIYTPRKIGKAVKRNRTKRLIREFIRHHWIFLPKNGQLIIRANSLILAWRDSLTSSILGTIQQLETTLQKKLHSGTTME